MRSSLPASLLILAGLFAAACAEPAGEERDSSGSAVNAPETAEAEAPADDAPSAGGIDREEVLAAVRAAIASMKSCAAGGALEGMVTAYEARMEACFVSAPCLEGFDTAECTACVNGNADVFREHCSASAENAEACIQFEACIKPQGG